MAFFSYDARIPSDVYEPNEHNQDQLDALGIPMDRRDGCKNYYADFKKCILVQHQTRAFKNWKSAGKEHCGYYFDHWNFCREKRTAEMGLSTQMNGI